MLQVHNADSAGRVNIGLRLARDNWLSIITSLLRASKLANMTRVQITRQATANSTVSQNLGYKVLSVDWYAVDSCSTKRALQSRVSRSV